MAMGKRRSEQSPLWVPTTALPVSPGHPFLREVERHPGGRRLRSVRGGGVPAILRAGDGTTESVASAVLPVAAGRLLRRARLRARDRVACRRLAGRAQLCRFGA